MFKKIGAGLAAVGAVVFGVCLRFNRPWQLRWGASDQEVARAIAHDPAASLPAQMQDIDIYRL